MHNVSEANPTKITEVQIPLLFMTGCNTSLVVSDRHAMAFRTLT